MKIIADLHLHSHFSRATSKHLNLEHLHKWAQLKGLNLVGTGDIAHPGWLQEMQGKLEPAEEGLFKLRDSVANAVQKDVFRACQAPVRFMLAGEISNIYKRHDKVRKVHNVVFMPSFQALEKFQAKLETIGNIRSDGRPILGLDSRDLLEIVLETDPQGHLIPAHIWTPWFALLGSMSGFDSVEAGFGDLTDHIFAVETGLSSDPPMNWRISMLDKYTLVSNSDAHSPQKLAREANLFETDLSYPALFAALRSNDPERFKGTIEFFPEEGKYHYDGHRKCGLRWHPQETRQHEGVCPECGRKVTVGVMHRVEALADHEEGRKPANWRPFTSLVPLPELLGEIHQVGVNSKKVRASFEFLLEKLGSELHILREVPLEEIKRHAGDMVAEGIRRMRAGEVHLAAGFDGEFGVIRVFDEKERSRYSAQLSLFVERVKQAASEAGSPKVAPVIEPPREKTAPQTQTSGAAETATDPLAGLNEEQRRAVLHSGGPLLIAAGPGTGKTRTLTHKIAHLVRSKGIPPAQVLAITFTNRAAHEMAERLAALLGEAAQTLTVCTFHALSADLLRRYGAAVGLAPDFLIAGDEEKAQLLKSIRSELSSRQARDYLTAIAMAKNNLLDPGGAGEQSNMENLEQIYSDYQTALRQRHWIDFEDLTFESVRLLEQSQSALSECRQRYRFVLVDEYQDIDAAQKKLLQLLAGNGSRLVAIGDPNQAIYSFRGADSNSFFHFADDFPGAQIESLNQNYRSTQTILAASTQVLAPEAETPNGLWSAIAGTKKITLHTAASDKAEAEFVVQQIESNIGGTSYFSIDSGRVADDSKQPQISLGDVAVLYRTKAQAAPLEEAFERSGIPYQMVGATPFYRRPSVEQILDYLWFFQNADDSYHLERMLKSACSGLGEKSIEKLSALATKTERSVWETLQHIEGAPGLNVRQKRAVQDFCKQVTALREKAASEPVARTISLVREFIAGHVADASPNQGLADRLIRFAKPFGRMLTNFLHTLALQDEADDYEFHVDRVALMTLHASKGLEFPIIFITGCEDGLLPFRHGDEEPNIDEERRLLYVGMTRAQSKLYLTHARKRRIFGKSVTQEPSEFLASIEAVLREQSETRRRRKKKEEPVEDKQLRLL